MSKYEFDYVPSPGYKGFANDQERRTYIDAHNQALSNLNQTQEVNWHLMNLAVFPGNLARTVYTTHILPDSEAYSVHNKYVRTVFKTLFPSDYVLLFARHNDISMLRWKHKISLFNQLLDARNNSNNQSSTFTVHDKLAYETVSLGVRYDLPANYYSKALHHLVLNKPIARSYLNYMSMLTLAALDTLNEHQEYDGQECIRLIQFLNKDAMKTLGQEGNNTVLALSQFINNYRNHTQLFTFIVNSPPPSSKSNLLFRHYFRQDKHTLVAKCGFINAFNDHIRNIVLNPSSYE